MCFARVEWDTSCAYRLDIVECDALGANAREVAKLWIWVGGECRYILRVRRKDYRCAVKCNCGVVEDTCRMVFLGDGS
jgi:hypothetical protein